MRKAMLLVTMLAVMPGCGGTREALVTGGRGNDGGRTGGREDGGQRRGDGDTTTPAADLAGGPAEGLGESDGLAATDGRELPDIELPPGCCLATSQCGPGMACARHSGSSEPGICLPMPEDGRCWGEAQCPAGQECKYASFCACGMECGLPQPGVCVTPGSLCNRVDPSWIEEICDAKALVVFDGQQCAPTCPGCCGCEPFCDLVFESAAECEAACGLGPCGSYIAALADCPYQFFTPASGPQPTCPQALCLAERCTTDDDCPLAGVGNAGDRCVTGNCVYCWQDSDCPDPQLCRAGRCVEAKPGLCAQAFATCPADLGKVVQQSEVPCPQCITDSLWGIQCGRDSDCLPFSFHPFTRCVYGRCVDCRNDDDCTSGRCLPPGVCLEVAPGPEELYGSWLIGIAAGLNHFSYFRFEPDGTLRRGSYQPPVGWTEFLESPCPSGGKIMPLLGSWEPGATPDGGLTVRMWLGAYCEAGNFWAARYQVEIAPDGSSMVLTNEQGMVSGWRVPATACTPDFAECVVPE